jgi:hypothetical protein
MGDFGGCRGILEGLMGFLEGVGGFKAFPIFRLHPTGFFSLLISRILFRAYLRRIKVKAWRFC